MVSAHVYELHVERIIETALTRNTPQAQTMFPNPPGSKPFGIGSQHHRSSKPDQDIESKFSHPRKVRKGPRWRDRTASASMRLMLEIKNQ